MFSQVFFLEEKEQQLMHLLLKSACYLPQNLSRNEGVFWMEYFIDLIEIF